MLKDNSRIRIVQVSGVYETAPWGKTDVPSYLNCAVALSTPLTAQGLLQYCQAVETACGRVREQRWGSRTLDIDIILYGDERVNEPDLIVPHPYFAERAFVLVPLSEVFRGQGLPDGRLLTDLVHQAGATEPLIRRVDAAAFWRSVTEG